MMFYGAVFENVWDVDSVIKQMNGAVQSSILISIKLYISRSLSGIR